MINFMLYVSYHKKYGNKIRFFFFVVLEFELRAYTLSHSTSPFFVKGFSIQGLLELFAPGWLPTVILLISAS
jgi:hypothetical protein